MRKQTISREAALQTIAIEVDKALRIGPVTHIKHKAVTHGQHGLGCLECHLLGSRDEQQYSLHDWGHYSDIKATSIIIPEAPRGFVITLKTDSQDENESRGSGDTSIPLEAKTPSYTGDYIKIDWVYPHKEIMGIGIPRNYFYAVEEGAKEAGYPSLHVDATNNGLSYWAQEKFGLKIPEGKHASLIDAYNRFKVHSKKYIQQASDASPYVQNCTAEPLPEEIDLSKPHTIPKIFMDVLGAIFMMRGGHLHFYKKFWLS